MKRPLEILKEQVTDLLLRASVNEDKIIRLTHNEVELFRISFGAMCYEVRFGKLDEVYSEFFKNEKHADGHFTEQDLFNLLQILDEVKTTY